MTQKKALKPAPQYSSINRKMNEKHFAQGYRQFKNTYLNEDLKYYVNAVKLYLFIYLFKKMNLFFVKKELYPNLKMNPILNDINEEG